MTLSKLRLYFIRASWVNRIRKVGQTDSASGAANSMVFGNLQKILILTSLVMPGIQTPLSAELPEDRGALGLKRAFAQLKTSARVLYVVAHPDDEDAGTLTLLARGTGASVTLLSLTRGEGGANLVTADTFDRLGALRTLEHLKAAEHYGVALRYTRFADFGFSKSVEETWKNWDRAEVLADVVRVVREVRPHVVIARFQGNPRDGHGHHIASGLMAREAFQAAADPSRFPETGPAWKPLKLYCDNWREGDAGVIEIDSGRYDPVLGRSYAELGREGYRYQRSQAMGAVLVRPGPFVTRYKRLDREVPDEKFFFDGIESELAPPPVYARFAEQAWAAWPNGEMAPALALGLQAARDAGDEEWIGKFNRALNLALGIELEAAVEPAERPSGMAAQFRPATTFRAATPRVPFSVRAQLHVRSGAPVETASIEVLTCSGPQKLDNIRLTCGPTAAHWRRASIADTKYEAESLEPLPPAPVRIRAEYRYRGVVGTIEKIPETSRVDAIGLEVREPLILGPGVSVRLSERVLVLRPGVETLEFDVSVRNESAGLIEGKAELFLPSGWKAEPDSIPFRLVREGEESRVRVRVIPGSQISAPVEIRARAVTPEFSSGHGFERVGYSGLGSVYLMPPATLTVRPVDVRVAPGLKVGYVMGSGDEVPAALRQLGVEVTELDANALATSDLSRYSAVMLGIRAYAARPELTVHNQRLLDYAKDGGVVIVQYNTQEYDRNFGPYPYSMTARAEEVSEENAPVAVLQPDARVFRTPNRITTADWEGWFEQRGSKFFTTWDANWTPLIETHDAGQAPQKGVWLEARYGKGLYVYCALAWYRQLPLGVPGAWRLFANLVSLGAR